MAGGKMRKEKPSRAGGSNHQYQGGISFHKSKGQHILKNPVLVDAIVQKSGIKSLDIIFEIGPCTGNLTKKLLEAGKSVIARVINKPFFYIPYPSLLNLQCHFYYPFLLTLIFDQVSSIYLLSLFTF
ncbi:hypothetical protein MKW94_028553 [Papaver nudicaule]|uniref:rRNA adenine N(6)-methyltransferase n=1 Tax=Papaver nudicaule TaxID=74823 RepID=A0AA42B599_PAPNU|nr:hypothetical protein [Papaver nudicaule]MCL7051928.1 hypothetical protein [Papaver nudicaule]